MQAITNHPFLKYKPNSFAEFFYEDVPSYDVWERDSLTVRTVCQTTGFLQGANIHVQHPIDYVTHFQLAALQTPTRVTTAVPSSTYSGPAPYRFAPYPLSPSPSADDSISIDSLHGLTLDNPKVDNANIMQCIIVHKAHCNMNLHLPTLTALGPHTKVYSFAEFK